MSAGAGPEPGRSWARVRAGRKREPGRAGPGPERSGLSARAGPEPGRRRARVRAGRKREPGPGSGVSARAGPEPGRSRAGAGQSQSGAEAGAGAGPERSGAETSAGCRAPSQVLGASEAGPEPGQSGAERAPAGPEPGQCEMADGRRNLLRCVATYAPKFRAGRSGWDGSEPVGAAAWTVRSESRRCGASQPEPRSRRNFNCCPYCVCSNP